MRGRLAPLAVRPFGRLLASYTINELGDSVALVALAILVFDRTGEVAPTAAFFMAAKFLPALLAPALTARADQLPLRRSLPAIYALEAAAFVALGLIADGDFILGLVLALGFVDGTLAITARGLTRGAVATLLQPAGLLREGNALMNIGFALSSVVGTAAAGLLITEFDLGTALYIDAASFLAIAAVLSMTRNLPSVSVQQQPWRERFGHGLQFARRQPLIRLLLGGEAVALVLFTLIVPIEVIYAKESLGTTDAGFGVLLGSWGLGIVVGSLIYLAVRQRSPVVLIAVSTAAIGVAYLGMATAETLLAACLFSVVGGAGNGVQWIAVMTALQEHTPADYQARVVGLLESVAAAVPGIGYLLGGVLAALGSPRTAYAVAGAGVLVLTLGALLLKPRLSARPLHEVSPGDIPPPVRSVSSRP